MDERYDLVRAVRDKQYRYIRNYMPFRITLQHVEFLFTARSAQAWENAFKAGKTNAVQSAPFLTKPLEELYDSEKDPWEVNNLAGNPAYASVLKKMRKVQTDWMIKIKDVGLIPEIEYKNFAGDKSMYDYMRSAACPFEELMEASDLATLGGKGDLNTFVKYLTSPNSAMRYWGVTGLLILKNDAKPAISALKAATADQSGAVATLAAEALYNMGEKEIAIKTYSRILKTTGADKENVLIFAMNSIDALNIRNPELTAIIQKMTENSEFKKGSEPYIAKHLTYFTDKWSLTKK